MGTCNSTNNKPNNGRMAEELRNVKTQYGNFNENIKSKSEEKARTIALKNIRTEHLRIKDLKDNIEKVDKNSFETTPVYDVQANIDSSKNEALIIFLIDGDVLKKFRSNVIIIVKAILNDFKRYFVNKQTLNDDSIMLNLLIYSSTSISSVSKFNFKNQLDLIFNLESTSLVNTNDTIGEVAAINKIIEMGVNDEKSTFIFHFLNKTSIKDEIYNIDIDDNIRNFSDAKYEILYFEGRNDTYERKLEVLIPYNTLTLE